MKTIAEWIDLYEKKTGDKFERKELFELIYFPRYGFAEIAVNNQSLFVWQMCGDARWWFAELTKIIQQMGLKHLVAYIVRPVRPFIRIFGYKIISIETAENKTQRYHCLNATGKKLTVTTMLDEKYQHVAAVFNWEVD